MTATIVPPDKIREEHRAADSAHGRIADIEILRAVAIIFVLIEHAPFNLFPWIRVLASNSRFYYYFGFWNGVDLFLAISGFVIARSLLPQLRAAGDATQFVNTTIAFWVRRIWRLLPSAWLWLAVILLCSVFLNRSGMFGSFRANFEGAVAAVLDVANFRILEVFGKYPPGASFPYWSLSLEEQFYLLLPLVVFFSGRRLPWVLVVAVAAQLFITRTGPETTHFGALINILRSDALCLGVLIAIWSRTETYRLFEPTALKSHPILRAAILLFLTVLLASIGSHNLHIGFFQVGLVALLSAVMVLIASYDRDYLLADSVIKRVLLWVGSRSYALYLVHIPAYFLTREIWFRIEPPGTVFGGEHFLRFVATAIGLIVTFAELNYRFVETPFRRRGARIARDLARRTA
ncbi:MAG TPA: acyltransferase [Alphaproteobacteria bacterium]|jgi:peptidoglycan/LPS O-acetylase OafA/YrhL|nr:acyltransferase [Alphaproteobacteria bacterium]